MMPCFQTIPGKTQNTQTHAHISILDSVKQNNIEKIETCNWKENTVYIYYVLTKNKYRGPIDVGVETRLKSNVIRKPRYITKSKI